MTVRPPAGGRRAGAAAARAPGQDGSPLHGTRHRALVEASRVMAVCALQLGDLLRDEAQADGGMAAPPPLGRH